MNIAVLSRNPALYSTQSLVRACYRRNHFVNVIDHMACDLSLDSGKLEIYYRGELLKKFDAIIPRVSSSITMASTTVIRQFELNGVFTIARSDAVLRAKDKFRSLQILASKGLSVPRTLLMNPYDFDQELLERKFDMPAIIKMLEGTHGAGVILSDSIINMKSTIEALYLKKFRCMIQDFVKESSGRDIRAIVVGNNVVASMQRVAKEGEFRSNLHQGGYAEPIALKEREIFMVKKATSCLGLNVAGVDLLRTNDKSYILEVNASPGLEGIETVTGVDVAGHIIRYLEKEYKRFRSRK